MKVVVDWELCEGNATCMQCAPKVFRVDDDDMLHVLIEHPDESLRANVEEAVRRCPRAALSIEELSIEEEE